MKVANLIVIFSGKYRWLEHYFSIWSLGNSQKLLKTNQFLVSTIFFTIMNVFFFSLRFDHRQRSQSNQEQCSMCCSSPCFLVLLCTHYRPLQCFSTYFRKLKDIEVFILLFLVTMEKWITFPRLLFFWHIPIFIFINGKSFLNIKHSLF